MADTVNATAHLYRDVCPLCEKAHREKSFKRLYGVRVCKGCVHSFANRRQGAYLIDWFVYFIACFILLSIVEVVFPDIASLLNIGTPSWYIFNLLISPLMFCLKDGFAGHSPGKWLTGVQVVDETTLEPISFSRSLKRNLITLVPLSPLLMSVQLIKGHRAGDTWASTKVIWKKYRHRVPFDMRGVACLGCGYDLTGNTSGRCPECGLEIPIHNFNANALAGAAPSMTAPFPTIVQAVLMTLTFLATQFVFGMLGAILLGGNPPGPNGLCIVNILSFASTMAIGLKSGNIRLREAVALRPVKPVLFIPITISLLGLTIVMSEMVNYMYWVFPPPDFLAEYLGDLFGDAEAVWPVFALFVLVAPITEEILFRGLLLGGMLGAYRSWKAIFVTATLFAAMHINPWQIPTAMILGVLFGWWFSRTGSLWTCLYGHALNNLIVILIALFPVDLIPGVWSAGSGEEEFQPLWFTLAGVALFLAGVAWCHQAFGPRPSFRKARALAPLVPFNAPVGIPVPVRPEAAPQPPFTNQPES